ncbi:hypothetical protein DEO72_LG2g2659 [Vigna unguiculata]|uniref:TF-B3 domain-containing protein n=1 Tax=Vigna unguiculata TaxID=3917 RepID=A0A4D6L1G8_VIGUN|nr:hypothetical protein DEO72_LG2g2659 [Vigna unguiculata]
MVHCRRFNISNAVVFTNFNCNAVVFTNFNWFATFLIWFTAADLTSGLKSTFQSNAVVFTNFNCILICVHLFKSDFQKCFSITRKDLNSDLCKYFRNSNFSEIVLYGPKAQVQCKLLIRARSVKIGSGWKNFCELHGLQEGDIILLEVDGEEPSSHVNIDMIFALLEKFLNSFHIFVFLWIHTNHIPRKPYFFADLHCFHISDSINGSLLNTSRQEINMSLSEVQKQTQNVSQVTPEKENWNIIVRVIRSWFVPDFTKQRCPFSMELVIQDKEVATFILFGTINHIWDEDDWWYTACVCNKAVYPDSKIYRIKVRVIDSSDSTTFVLFDRDATTLFKKTCVDMLESHDKIRFTKVLLHYTKVRYQSASHYTKDVYAGNGEFSREKQHVVNESTVDIAEDLLVRFTKETIECAS